MNSRLQMKAYSQDLRQKIIDAYTHKEGSIREVAARFKVARSFVQKLLKQYQQEGTVSAKPHGGGASPKLPQTQWYIVEELVVAKNDATLEELCHKLEQKTGCAGTSQN